jgi:hypothetical protein
MALFPSQIYFSVLVSNDALSWVLAAAFMLVILRAPQGLGNKEAALAALLLVASFYTKSSATLLLPFLVAAVVNVREWAERRKILVIGASVAAVVFVATLPWHLRNVRLYGSVFALDAGSGEVVSWSKLMASEHQMRMIARDAVAELWWPFDMNVFRSYAFMVIGYVLYVGMLAMVIAGVRQGLRTFAKWPLGVLAAQAALCLLGFAFWSFRRAQPEPRLYYACLPALLIAIAAWFASSPDGETDGTKEGSAEPVKGAPSGEVPAGDVAKEEASKP